MDEFGSHSDIEKDTESIRTRGATKQSDVNKKKSEGQKFLVEFDANGEPTGEGGKKLISSIGSITRHVVPITNCHWKKVDKKLTDQIWLYILEAYIVDYRFETKVKQIAGRCFQSFKTELTTKHIIPFLTNPAKLATPPLKYCFIPQHDWEEFVRMRTSPKFLKLREEKQQCRALNKHNHRLSRGGYKLLEQKIRKETGNYTAPIVREQMWKRARLNEKGEYEPETQVIVEKIDEISEKFISGEFVPKGMNDVLTEALGTPEHNGRVRGMGRSVKPSIYFHTPLKHSSAFSSQENTEIIIQRIAKLEKNSQPTIPKPTSEISSSKVPQVDGEPQLYPTINKSKKRKCKLALGLKENIVARGTIMEFSFPNVRVLIQNGVNQDAILPIPPDQDSLFIKDVLGRDVLWPMEFCFDGGDDEIKSAASKVIKTEDNHNTQKPRREIIEGKTYELALGSSDNIVAIGTALEYIFPQVRVIIDVVKCPDAILPIPSEDPDMMFLSHASGNIVLWPVEFVLDKTKKEKVINDTATSSKRIVLDPLVNNPPEIRNFSEKILPHVSNGKNIHVKHEDLRIYGQETFEYIGSDEIANFLNMVPIDGSIISLYIRLLHERAIAEGRGEIFGFINPGVLGIQDRTLAQKKRKKLDIVLKRLRDCNGKKLIIMPYNPGFHWILVVFDYQSWIMYYLDPLRNAVDEEVTNFVGNAMQTFHAEISKKRKPPLKCIEVQAPVQPGYKECGYYVMRYIKDILHDHQILHEKFSGKSYYSQEEIDQVRIEWTQYIMQLVSKPELKTQ